MGRVVEGRARLLGTAGGRVVLPRPAGAALPRVPLIVAALGADEPDRDLVADGLVVAAFGVGHLPQWWVRPLVIAGRVRRIRGGRPTRFP